MSHRHYRSYTVTLGDESQQVEVRFVPPNYLPAVRLPWLRHIPTALIAACIGMALYGPGNPYGN